MENIFLLRNGVFAFLVFIIYFQVPFSELSGYISPLLAIYFLLSSKSIISFQREKSNLTLTLSWLIFLSLNLLAVAIDGGDIERGIRFFLILVLIVLAFGTENKKDVRIQYKIFMALTICKVIYLIVLAMLMIMYGDYMPFRTWANLNGYGDIYFVYDLIPRVQIYGNSLLIIAMLVEFFTKRKITLLALFIMVGVFIAGNLAFIVAIFLLILYVYFKKYFHLTIKGMLSFLLLLIFMVPVCLYMSSENDRKVDGGNAVKVAQLEILLDNGNLFMGNGLGDKVPKMKLIGYSEKSLYYEMQSAYIFYQIGFLGFAWFVVLNIIFLRRYKNNGIYVFYGIYIVSACANPYFFDSTHILAVHFLSNVFDKN